MKSDISINPKQLIKGFSNFMHRYHVVLFSLIVLGGLSAATFVLYQTAISAQSVEPTNSKTNFDSNTLSEIRELRSSDDASQPLKLPSGRTNPFQD